MKPDFTDIKDKIAFFCQENGIRKLAVFGSVTRDTFSPESDINILVEFASDKIPTLFDITGIERELSGLFGGRKVDLRTAKDLSRYFRDRIVQEAKALYKAE